MLARAACQFCASLRRPLCSDLSARPRVQRATAAGYMDFIHWLPEIVLLLRRSELPVPDRQPVAHDLYRSLLAAEYFEHAFSICDGTSCSHMHIIEQCLI